MRILAVIPARSGSKRIPNKNIRLVGDKPLVFYAISNAKQSRFVTDILVTTDSEEVVTVANQMDVPVHRRSSDLCTDEATLDPVVWDAVSSTSKSYDYVVTLQPTSPTLRVETLDKAIEFALSCDADTVVSVRSMPTLAWIKQDNAFVPTYGKRENSQYLPPYYAETGAFVISKPSIMSPHSRIGGSVQVFEVSDDEALSVRTFQDLALARLIMNESSVGFYVHGNNVIGAGHIFRVMELVDEFYSKPKIYFDINTTDSHLFRENGYDVIGVDGDEGLFEQLRSHPYTIFINDVLSTTEEYMTGLRTCIPHARIVNFEDEGPGSLLADLVFNALLEKSNNRKVKVGSDYYIAPKSFLMYRPIKIREKVRDVLITFGGADPQNYTDKVLDLIVANAEEYSGITFHVVLGPAKKPLDNRKTYDMCTNIKISENITNMSQVMSSCDIALASRGRTCYELAVLGIPTISIAENAREETHSFVSHENGFHYLGFQPSAKMIKAGLDLYLGLNRDERQIIQDGLLKTDLRNGRRRVMGLIHSL